MKTDYLVYVPILAGGSWARGDNLGKTITRAQRLFKMDWGHLLKTGKVTANYGVFDVTGYDQVYMSDGCVFAYDGDDQKHYFEPIVQDSWTFTNK